MVPNGVTLNYMESAEEVARIAAAQAGDTKAFLALVRHYGRPLYRAAFAMSRDPERAASLTRDTFVRAWMDIHEFPDGQRFFPWALRIARSLFPTPEPVAPPATADQEHLTLAAFSELRPEEQMILSLRLLERISYEDLASVLGLTLGVATLRLSQARGHLLSRAAGGGEIGT